jgi:predicted outer membrane repeat protein
MTRRATMLTIGFVCSLALGPTGKWSAAATLTVCPSGCDHVLIQAAAVAANPGDTVQILSLSPHTEGEIFITKDLTIDGFGEASTVIQANATAGLATVPVFVVQNGATATFLDLTIRHGGGSDGGGISVLDGTAMLQDVTVTTNAGGGVFVDVGCSLQTLRATITSNSATAGGGIRSAGTISLTDTVVSYNDSEGFGGGIAAEGSVELNGCEILSNTTVWTFPIESAKGGGVVFAGSSMTIRDSTIAQNSSQSQQPSLGGGLFIASLGSVSILGSTITGNDAETGGGIHANVPELSIEDSSITMNSAEDGAGLYVDPSSTTTLSILRTTISSNTAGDFAGVYLEGTDAASSIVNSTISGNQATNHGGGLVVETGQITVASSTITNNTADSDSDNFGNGGGIIVESTARLTLKNSIVSGNVDGSSLPSPIAPDCSGTLESGGYNLIGFLGAPLVSCTVSGDITGNVYGADAALLPLADNGGPTWTHAFDGASLAVNAGNPTGCTDADGLPLPADQRTWIRQDACDAGAYEYGALAPALFSDGFESSDTTEWSSAVGARSP